MSEMQPGREMDAAVAKAIGWESKECDAEIVDYDGQAHCPRCRLWLSTWENLTHNETCASYSTSDADALAALDAVMAKHPGWGWEMVCDNEGATRLLIYDGLVDTQACGTGPNRRVAICVAILWLAEVTHA
mgnify:CR=1 FL=1